MKKLLCSMLLAFMVLSNANAVDFDTTGLTNAQILEIESNIKNMKSGKASTDSGILNTGITESNLDTVGRYAVKVSGAYLFVRRNLNYGW